MSSKIALGLGSVAAAASSCLVKLDACNLRAFFAEKRTKEARYAPANRLEFTAGVSFNFAQVRLPRRVSAGTATSSPHVFFPSHQSPLSPKIATSPKNGGKPAKKIAGTLGRRVTRNTQPMPLTSCRAASCEPLRQVPIREFTTHAQR